MSITVSSVREAEACDACEEADEAKFQLSGDSQVTGGASVRLCTAHALRMWNALGAMLMMGDEPVLKMGARGPGPNARGRKLL